MKVQSFLSILLLLELVNHFGSQAEGKGKLIFCYYSSFAQRRLGVGHFLPEDINPHLCTHIIYAFVDITADGTGLKPFNRNDAGPNGLYARTLALKEKNPSLKILLAVGGWKIGSKPFLPMISDETNRKVWVQNVISYLREYGFDGFDMDWEFPGTRGSPPEDKYRFTLLMKELYQAFAEESARTGEEKLILTLAAASGTFYIDQSYEPYKIIKYFDYMLLMTYNYHGQWEKQTGHHSGLYRHKDDPTTGEKSELHQQWSINYWLEVGVPKNRLIVGIPTYAMTFTLSDPSEHGVHAPVSGGGKMGEFTQETGILSYYEICTNLQDNGWKSEWINEQAVPYAYGDDQWAGYESVESIRLKSENIVSRDLAGAFVWAVELDDFRGTCGQGKYPLLSTIQKLIGQGSVSSPAAGHKGFQQELAINMKHEREEIPIGQDSELNNQSRIEVRQPGVKKKFIKKLKRKQYRNKSVQTDAAATDALINTPSSMTSSSDTQTTTANNDKGRLVVTWWKSPAKTRGGGQVFKVRRRKMFRPRKLWKQREVKDEDGDQISPKYSTIDMKPSKPRGDSSQNVKTGHAQGHSNSGSDQHVIRRPPVSKIVPWPSLVESSQTRPTRRLPHRPKNTMTGHLEGHTNRGSSDRHHIRRPPVTSQPLPRHDHSQVPQMNQPINAVASFSSHRAEVCKQNGVGTYADPESCDSFVMCIPGDWQDYSPLIMLCPTGTRFDNKLQICNFASHVDCSY